MLEGSTKQDYKFLDALPVSLLNTKKCNIIRNKKTIKSTNNIGISFYS